MTRPLSVFKDKKDFDEMVQMLKDNVSYTSIAERFNCDRTTIMFHGRKLGIEHTFKRTYTYKKEPLPRVKVKDFYMENGEKINVGHDYQYYRNAERAREQKELDKKFKKLLKKGKSQPL